MTIIRAIVMRNVYLKVSLSKKIYFINRKNKIRIFIVRNIEC